MPSKPGDSYIPSVDMFFESAAAAYGPLGLGIILTGMGSDGAKGLHAMRKSGAITIAQNENSSVVYGMPRVAMETGAAIEEMDPGKMIDLLLKIKPK